MVLQWLKFDNSYFKDIKEKRDEDLLVLPTDAVLFEDPSIKAWKLWREGAQLELLDPALRDSCSREEVIRCFHIGLLCVQEDPSQRPKMRSIVVMLNSHSVTMPDPQHIQAWRTYSSMPTKDKELQSDQSTSKSNLCSVDEDYNSELYP